MKKPKNEVKGIVLAGGVGKRLRPLSYYFQKCMIPIGHRQKPLMEYIIRLLRYHNIDDISILVGYKHEQICNYFNHGDRFNVNINYVLDDPAMKGTGGSLLNAYRHKTIAPDDVLLIYYGDILSDINLTAILNRHYETEAVATLALSEGFKIRVGVAEVKDETITGWAEKPTLPIQAGIGICILNASTLKDLEQLSKHNDELDIMSHLIPHLIKKKVLVNAFSSTAFWYDVGSIEMYEKLENGIIDERLGFLLTK